MPRSLERFQHTGELHFITFSCYRRRAKLTPERRYLFERSLEMVRKKNELQVFAYVLMPEHVHVLVSEPESKELATAMQALKRSVSRRAALRAKEPFWQPRYYDTPSSARCPAHKAAGSPPIPTWAAWTSATRRA